MNKLTQKLFRKMHSWLSGSDEVQLAETGLLGAEPRLSRSHIYNPGIYLAMCLLLFGTLVFSGQAHGAPHPTVTAISPASGPTAGGTSVTITGTNFTGATAVTIGGAAATSVVVVSATSITAVTPAGTAGAQNVAVTTPGGTGTGTNLYTYATAPTVTGISPGSGPTAGGTSVTISGTNFTGATAVTIGGAAATSVVVVSATSITAVTPAGTAGAQNVAVTTPGGTGTGTKLYTYIAAPTVTAPGSAFTTTM